MDGNLPVILQSRFYARLGTASAPCWSPFVLTTLSTPSHARPVRVFWEVAIT